MLREALQRIDEAMKGLDDYELFTSYGLTYLYKADDELAEAISSYNMEGMESKIMFVFGIKEDMYMDAVWARKGFGPLAYMVAMQMQGTLAPNWNYSQITKSAERIWQEFFNGKGEKLVNKELVGSNPESYKSYWYSLKNL